MPNNLNTDNPKLRSTDPTGSVAAIGCLGFVAAGLAIVTSPVTVPLAIIAMATHHDPVVAHNHQAPPAIATSVNAVPKIPASIVVAHPARVTRQPS